MVWYVDKAVFLTNLVEDALVGKELRFHDRSPLLVLQFLVSAIRERHQILVVLVSSASQRSVQLLGVQSLTKFFLEFLRNLLVVDYAHGFTLFAAVYAQGNLLHGTEVGIIIHLHLGILGKLEAVGTVGALLETEEYQWQTVSDYIVEIHDVVETIACRYLHPASIDSIRYLYYGVFLLLVILSLFYSEVDAVILQGREVVYLVEPDRVDRTIELVVEELRKELLLLVVELVFGEQTNLVNFKLSENCIHRFSVFFRIRFIEFIYCFERFLDLCFGILFELLVEHSVEGCHTDTEELVEVIGVNTEEREAFQQWHILFLCLLQNAMVKIHPTDIALYISFLHNVFSCHDCTSLIL